MRAYLSKVIYWYLILSMPTSSYFEYILRLIYVIVPGWLRISLLMFGVYALKIHSLQTKKTKAYQVQTVNNEVKCFNRMDCNYLQCCFHFIYPHFQGKNPRTLLLFYLRSQCYLYIFNFISLVLLSTMVIWHIGNLLSTIFSTTLFHCMLILVKCKVFSNSF